MNIDAAKVELIDWIVHLRDQEIVNEVLSIKQKLSKNKQVDKPKTRKFGSGKNLIEFIADDFDAPLEMFSDYQK